MELFLLIGFAFVFYLLVKKDDQKQPIKNIHHKATNYDDINDGALHLWEEIEDDENDIYPDEFEVVGESHYQGNIKRLSNLNDLIAYLIPEESNPHDKKAVRVDINKLTVGYLAKEDAREFRKKLTKNKLGTSITRCKASITGGGESNGKKYMYGVELDFSK